MPNQRSKKKKFVGGYVNYRLKLAIEAIAIEEDRKKSEIVEQFLSQGVERYKSTGSFGKQRKSAA
jgi:hypothetical protein